MTLHWIDFSIIAAYLVAVTGIGLWIAQRDKQTGDGFFVAGRSLGWVTIGASLFASNISSEHLIGLAGDGFRTGLPVGNYEWGACIILLILAVFFAPFYVGSKIRTMPEYLEKRFGRGAAVYLSLMTIIANVLVRISVALYAGGIVINSMFGVNLWGAMAGLAVVTVVYTALGGLKAVVYTDLLQTVILFFGTIFLTLTALDKVGGWTGLQAQLDASMFDMVRPASDPEMPWTGLVLGVPVLGIWYWCTDQVIVQRVLGAKNVHQARMGALFAAFLKISPVFLFVLPGLCARVLFPEIDGKAAFPTLVQELLPVGLKGVVAAALIAALMSSIDSTLNSTGTLFSLDFYKKWKPEATPQQVVAVGRWATLVVMVFGLLWVNVVAESESLFQYLQQVNAAISPPIAASFLMGVFWPRANHQGVMSALICGLVIGLSLMVADVMPFLVAAGVTFFASLAILVIGSLLTDPPPAYRLDQLVWRDVDQVVNKETTARQRIIFKFGAGLLVVIMIGLWMMFS